MRKVRRYVLRLLIGICAIILVVLVAVRTSWVRSWVKGTLETAVSESMNGSLTIERLGGNLLGDVTLEGVVLRVELDTLAKVDHLHVRFGVFGLLTSHAIIEELAIQGVDVRITQNAEGGWITSRIARPSGEVQVQVEPPQPFPWTIKAERIRLTDGSVLVGSDSGAIIIRAVALSGSALFSEAQKSFVIDSLSFTSRNPEFTLKHLSAEASLDHGALVLNKALILTERNSLTVAGRYGGDGPSEVILSSSPLDLSEIPGIPTGLNTALRPTVSGRAHMLGDSVDFAVAIERSKEKVNLSGRIGALSAEQRSDFEVTLQHADLAAWFPHDLPSTDLNGSVEIVGAGLDPDQLRAELIVSMAPSRVLDGQVKNLEATATYRRGSIRARIDLGGDFGRGHIEGSANDVRTMSSYDLTLRGEHVNLAIPLKNSDLESDLWVECRLRGQGADIPEGPAEFEISARGVSPKGIAVDTFAASGTLLDGRVDLRRLRLVNSEVATTVSGWIDLEGRFEGESTAEIADPRQLLQLVGLDSSVSLSGLVHVTAGGDLDSLKGDVEFSLHDAVVSPGAADALEGGAAIRLQDGALRISGNVEAHGVEVAALKAQTVQLAGSYGTEHLEADASIQFSEDLTVSLRGAAQLGDTIALELPSLAVDLEGSTWTNTAGPVNAIISGTRVSLTGFTMQSAEQSVAIEGTFDSGDSVDVRVAVDTTELEPFVRVAGIPVAVSGRTNLRLNARGPATSPRIELELHGRDVVLGSQPVGALALVASSSDGRVAYDLSILDTQGNEVKSSGRIPVSVTAQGITVDRDSAISARLETKGYDLAWLRSMRDELEHVAGSLSAHLEISGRLSEPEVSGLYMVSGGELRAPSLGLDVKNLALAGGMDGPRMWLDSLGATVGGGRLRASGGASFSFGDTLSLLDSLNIVVTGTRLSASLPRRFEVQTDAELRVVFAGRELNYEGRFTVPESRVYLPGLSTKFAGSRRAASRPLLVQATVPFDSAVSARSDTSRGRRGLPVVGDRTRGRVSVSFPKNAWIQSPNINVELYGDLVAFQTDTLLELEGTLRISRGTVQFVGKRFQVKTGRAEFFRGPTINPAFTVELEYRFRDVNQKDRSLTARISGTAEAPTVAFALEEKALTQQDAISYLLFSRSVDELTLNQQSSMSSGDDNMGASMAFDMLGAQLSNVIAQRVGLDVVEIKSAGGTKAGTLMAGKYIAEGVFISYEKGFGDYGVNETVPEIFTIEYELIRSLFLQLVQANDRRSGGDIIYKIR